jgi:transcriptional regulator with XRE-family HTH domain
MARHRTAEEKVQLAEQARALRAAGRSRREIEAALGIGDDLAKELLRGVPVPASLRRARAKDDVREKARELREAGWTYPQIAKELGVSKSSCSLWLRDIVHPLPGLEGQARRTAAIRASAAKTQEMREADRVAFKGEVADALGQVSNRDVLIALAVSYWCEGGKTKPWARRERLQWMNSDLMLVRLFLEGLRTLGITDDRIRLRLSIHESANEAAARRWWAERLDWREDAFMRSTIKRHNPKTVRKNVADDYHGCLTVTVLQSRLLYQLLDGLVHGLAQAAGAVVIGGSMEVADEAM